MTEGMEIFTDRKIYSVPNGLHELMYDIAKEVLRTQPKNLYRFIAQYLITLLKVREAVKVAVPVIENNFETAESHTAFLKKYNLTKEQADRFATVIQAAYRGYRTRKRLLSLVDEYMKAEENWKLDTTASAISEYEVDYTDPVFKTLKTRGVTREQAIEAVTKIQAYYRGYKVRKMEETKGIACLVRDIPSHESWRHDWLVEPIVKKAGPAEDLPWRKSFTDFHKHLHRKLEGDRLHIETIFNGQYEDYNWVCDYSSCQEVVIPTQLEAKEMMRPGDLDSLMSEELNLSGIDIEAVKKTILSEGVSLEGLYPETTIFEGNLNQVVSTISTSPFIHSVKSSESKGEVLAGSDHLPTREKSQTLLNSQEPVHQDLSSKHSFKSESSKSKGSRLSLTSKSKKSSGGTTTPALSVRSLSHAEGDEKDVKSQTSAHPSPTSGLSQGSKQSGEKVSMGSKKSVASKEHVSLGSKKSATSQDQVSKGSKKSASIEHVSLGSKKSAVSLDKTSMKGSQASKLNAEAKGAVEPEPGQEPGSVKSASENVSTTDQPPEETAEDQPVETE